MKSVLGRKITSFYYLLWIAISNDGKLSFNFSFFVQVALNLMNDWEMAGPGRQYCTNVFMYLLISHNINMCTLILSL